MHSKPSRRVATVRVSMIHGGGNASAGRWLPAPVSFPRLITVVVTVGGTLNNGQARHSRVSCLGGRRGCT